ncbi:MAG: DUF1707 domain-containing protein [Spirochaetales bacterium]|nr:DUF1707 domain-containing protein [Spirochaetales bacterium]
MNSFFLNQSANLRASDTDRQRVAEQLNEALVCGRLTLIEHEERLENLYRAKTLAELNLLTADLPLIAAHPSVSSTSAVNRASEVHVVLGKIHRTLAGPVEAASASVMLGNLVWDLSQAAPVNHEIRVEVAAVCSKVILTVPSNAVLIDETQVVLGKIRVPSGMPQKEVGPTIRLMGNTVLTKLVIRRASP